MILTTCKYFDLVGNRCSRVTDGKCNDLQDCEFKYIAELKAENDRLKKDYIKLSQQKDLDNARWQKRCTDLHIEDKAKADKYWLVLQEIKAIAIRAFAKQQEYKKDFGEIIGIIANAGSEG